MLLPKIISFHVLTWSPLSPCCGLNELYNASCLKNETMIDQADAVPFFSVSFLRNRKHYAKTWRIVIQGWLINHDLCHTTLWRLSTHLWKSLFSYYDHYRMLLQTIKSFHVLTWWQWSHYFGQNRFHNSNCETLIEQTDAESFSFF